MSAEPSQHADTVHLLLDKSRPEEERLQALLALAQSNLVPTCIDALVELLHDENEKVDLRCSVALVLGRTGGATAIDALITLARHAQPQIRNYVAQALGDTNDINVAPTLVESLEDEDNHVFASAAEALGKLGPHVVPVLCEVLDTGADDARCVAAWQLGELRDIRGVDTLLKQARHNDNQDIQALCLWALGEVGQHRPDVLEVVGWAQQQDAPEIRLRADVAIKKIVRHVN